MVKKSLRDSDDALENVSPNRTCMIIANANFEKSLNLEPIDYIVQNALQLSSVLSTFHNIHSSILQNASSKRLLSHCNLLTKDLSNEDTFIYFMGYTKYLDGQIYLAFSDTWVRLDELLKEWSKLMKGVGIFIDGISIDKKSSWTKNLQQVKNDISWIDLSHQQVFAKPIDFSKEQPEEDENLFDRLRNVPRVRLLVACESTDKNSAFFDNFLSGLKGEVIMKDLFPDWRRRIRYHSNSGYDLPSGDELYIYYDVIQLICHVTKKIKSNVIVGNFFGHQEGGVLFFRISEDTLDKQYRHDPEFAKKPSFIPKCTLVWVIFVLTPLLLIILTLIFNLTDIIQIDFS